jgi:pimeloyl-ACP methyl ester carboxylesterase
MQTRNAASVLPDPVGAAISVCLPAAISCHPAACGSVGPAGNRRPNQARTAGWNESSTRSPYPGPRTFRRDLYYGAAPQIIDFSHETGTIMETVRSADGTAIAYDQAGHGPALIIIDGATSTRSGGTKPQLVNLLAARFTVLTYDRRGRGDSGDTQPYAVGREIEDIAALLDQAGPAAYLYGHSSGGCLALDAALRLGPKVGKLAIYEPPYNDDPAFRPVWAEYLAQLAAALADNRRGDAAALFMRLVGMPAEQVDAMRQAPFWPGMEAVAPTLAYDHAGVMGPDPSVPVERAARVDVPALVMYGTASPLFMAATATLSKALPRAELRALHGQDHNVDPAVLAPVLTAFLSA